MRIAILTLPLKSNYGGIMQNYALQKILLDKGHETITLNIKYRKDTFIRSILIRVKDVLFKWLLRKNRITVKDRQKIIANTKDFIKHNINLSKIIGNPVELSLYFKENKFDVIIVGSDQTWRPIYSPNIYNYFLDFLENNSQIKKIAYASSFGTSEWEFDESQTEKCKKLIQKFQGISVREKSGIGLCNSFFKVNAAVCLDPTLLLDEKDYSILINKNRENKGLFTYVLDCKKETTDFIHECARILNLKINTNQAAVFDSKIKQDFNKYLIPPVEDWLQGFRDAQFIITDSFHGTVFSIINHKPFISIANMERGASRFESILDQLGLSHRLIYSIEEFDYSLLYAAIDYNEVDRKLEELRANSEQFLFENIRATINLYGFSEK